MYIVKNEIDSQFSALEQTVIYLENSSEMIKSFFERQKKIVIFGCGSSFSVAKSYAMMFTGLTDIPAFPVAAGDYLVNEKDYSLMIKDSGIIVISRSGSTSEIIRAVKSAKDAGAGEVISVCGVKGAAISELANVNLEMPWIYDNSVCQTRTVSNFYATGLMMAAIYAKDLDTIEKLKNASSYYESFRNKYEPVFKEIAKKQWAHAVVLADSFMAGLAEEGALAFKEICQLNSNHYHVLDVRHGPMVMINKETLVISMISSSERQLQQAVLNDISKKGAVSVVVDCNPCNETLNDVDFRICLPDLQNDKVAAIFMLYCIQNITYEKALLRGVNPDQPDGLDAWIELP